MSIFSKSIYTVSHYWLLVLPSAPDATHETADQLVGSFA